MNTGVKKSGMVEVKKNTVVTVIEKNGLQMAGGAVCITLGGSDADMKLSSGRSTLLCSSLEVTLQEGDSYVWVAFLLNYCYPFMQVLTLNRCGV